MKKRQNFIWIITHVTSLTVPTVTTDLVINVLKSVLHLKSTCLDGYEMQGTPIVHGCKQNIDIFIGKT